MLQGGGEEERQVIYVDVLIEPISSHTPAQHSVSHFHESVQLPYTGNTYCISAASSFYKLDKCLVYRSRWYSHPLSGISLATQAVTLPISLSFTLSRHELTLSLGLAHSSEQRSIYKIRGSHNS